jgi:hypothetical protein
MKYRKKAIVIEAAQLTYKSILSTTAKEEQLPEWITNNPDITIHVTTGIIDSQYAEIKTLEGIMIASKNDWIIKGINGECYPCKPDIFTATYDEEREV